MRRLLLLRHAKSAWGATSLPDRERSLALRGRRAAALIGAEIARRSLRPDRILCSPAERTRETLAALLPHLAEPTETEFVEGLYEPPAGNYRDVIAAHGGNAATLLVIGHNPAIQATAVSLIGAGERALQSDVALKFPTAALAVIAFDDTAWAQIRPGTGELVAFLRPRDLDAAIAED